MISKSTILLSLLSLLPHIHAQELSCDTGTDTETISNVGPGQTAQFSLAQQGPGTTQIGYEACDSTVPHSIVIIEVNTGNIVDTCDTADPDCTTRCIAQLGDTSPFTINVTNESPTDTGDLTLFINCEATTTLAPTLAPTTTTTTTTGMPSATPTATPTTSPVEGTPSPTEDDMISSTMDGSDESLDFSSESGSESDDDDDEDLDDEDIEDDDQSDIVSLDGSDESDDSAEAQNGRTNNVFEARSQAGENSNDDMVWKYMWGIVAVFGAINVAICYCMLKNRNQIKRGEVSFQKVENSVEVL